MRRNLFSFLALTLLHLISENKLAPWQGEGYLNNIQSKWRIYKKIKTKFKQSGIDYQVDAEAGKQEGSFN